MIILGKTKISVALKEHPELKKVLMGMSPKFSKLENSKIFGIVSKWATFSDVARVGKISICELLHTLNNEIGNEDKLYLSFPECINELEKKKPESVKPTWIDEIKQLVIFDEINVTVAYGLLDEEKVLEVLRQKPDGVELVLTGISAPESFIKIADLVSEVQEVKHYYKEQGILSRPGIDR